MTISQIAISRLRSVVACLVVGGLFFSINPSNATTYTVDLQVGPGSISGYIQTDGTIGALAADNLIGWNLLLDDGSTSVLAPLVSMPGPTSLANPAFTATATGLFYDFSYPSNPYLIFYGAGGYACFTGNINCFGFTNSISLQIGANAIVSTDHTGLYQIGSEVPLPAALPLFATGLVGLGLLGWRRSRRHLPRA